jgi:hypothetical protein
LKPHTCDFADGKVAAAESVNLIAQMMLSFSGDD